jgi:hypothetical protein
VVARRRTLVLGMLIVTWTSGCVRRDHLNSRCEWFDEPPGMLDLRVRADEGHLRDDAQLAEEFAVRYGDTARTYQPASLTEVRRRRQECLVVLFRTVGTIHQVPQREIERARLLRDARVDIGAVFLPMALLLSAIAMYIWRRFGDLLAGSPMWLTLAAMLTLSIVASAATVQGGELWANSVEMLRVGNQHISMRGNRSPWAHHRTAIFVGGITLFWLPGVFRFLRETHHVDRGGDEA